MSVKQMALVWEHEFDHAEQSVMLALADHAHDDGTGIRPSMARVAWKTGYSERQVKRIVKRLRDERRVLMLVRNAVRGRPPEYVFVWDNAESKAPFVPPTKLTEKARRQLLEDLIVAQGPTCTYCGCSGDDKTATDGQPWHVDRVIPAARGGDYTAGNVTLSCGTCNRRKGAKTAPQMEHDKGAISGDKGAISGDKGATWEVPQPSEEPSLEPSVVEGNVTYLDEVTRRCLPPLREIRNFTRDEAHVAKKLHQYRGEWPNVDAEEVCRDYREWCEAKRKSNPSLLQLRNFFKQAAKDSGSVRAVASGPMGRRNLDG